MLSSIVPLRMCNFLLMLSSSLSGATIIWPPSLNLHVQRTLSIKSCLLAFMLFWQNCRIKLCSFTKALLHLTCIRFENISCRTNVFFIGHPFLYVRIYSRQVRTSTLEFQGLHTEYSDNHLPLLIPISPQTFHLRTTLVSYYCRRQVRCHDILHYAQHSSVMPPGAF